MVNTGLQFSTAALLTFLHCFFILPYLDYSSIFPSLIQLFYAWRIQCLDYVPCLPCKDARFSVSSSWQHRPTTNQLCLANLCSMNFIHPIHAAYVTAQWYSPLGGDYPSPSLSSCSINPQGNSLSEDQEDAGIMLPLLSTIRGRVPLLRELDLGSYNVSGFVVHRNQDLEGWKELGDGFKMLMNHDNVYNYPWRGLAQSADKWICFKRFWRTLGCCWKNAQSLYIYLGDHLGSLTIPGLRSPSTYCKHRQFWLRIGHARLYTTLH